jgi:hypothetical protein
MGVAVPGGTLIAREGRRFQEVAVSARITVKPKATLPDRHQIFPGEGAPARD